MYKNLKELYSSGLNYEDLTEDQKMFFRLYFWNGVGSREYLLDPPDSIFSNASIYHDFWYLRGGPANLRKLADLDFYYRCISKIETSRPEWQKPFYHILAFVYFYGLKLLGKKAWEKREAAAHTWEEFLERNKKYLKN